MTSADTGARRARGPAAPETGLSLFFSHAFRPFFLAAGIYSIFALAAWLFWIAIHAAGAMPAFMSVAEPLHLWHGHEMVFGYGAAAVGGFLLTAIPSWSGAPRSKGRQLAFMFALWIAGRIAMWSTAYLPPAVPLVVDLAFLPVLGVAAARQLAVQPALRNVIFLSLLIALAAGNLLYHMERIGMLEGGMHTGVLLGLSTLVVMITVIGGRVIPGFTINALRRRGIEDEKRLPVRRAAVDRASLALSAIALLLFVFGAPRPLTGAVALGAALANAIRLSGWRWPATLGDPIVWVLHLGYGWIVAGFALLSLALLSGWMSEIAALHAFASGAVGTMTMAIMTRASLGHTGRPLKAPRPVVAAYILVSVAALLRCFGPGIAPQLYNEIMIAAGVAWIAAFAFYAWVFAPILTRPRAPKAKPATA